MNKRIFGILLVSLVLSTAVAARADSGSPAIPASSEANGVPAEYARLAEELNQLEAGLPAKREELARLRRKWVVVKGRMPSAEELKKYKDKQAKGKATVEDNPYMNKSPLSSPGLYREAYFNKLNEIRGDEARIARLKDELAGMNR